MKINEAWLREWVNPGVDIQQLSHQLTMAGLEVEALNTVAPPFSKVVVGFAVKVEQHPDADRLRVCQIDAGQGELISIVCGAANMRQGLKVPVALVGAVLPGDFKIQKAKLRGVVSMGMICSEKELGLLDESDGIMELPADAPIGQDIRAYLRLNDHIIEIGLTANRGDCLSVRGLAREVAAVNQCAVISPEIKPVVTKISDIKTVSVTDPVACQRYVGRIVKNINPNASTPAWMIERLSRVGIRTISPVVDVTNYVMLSLGQPMHAFDLDKLHGEIHVRKALPGESLVLLKGQNIELQDDELIIADQNGPLALAGIMGGEASSVTEDTRHVFLESAYFTAAQLAGKARRRGLHTDSSHRFERGVDPEITALAMEYATQLLLAITGGEAGPVQDWRVPLEGKAPILLSTLSITKRLGMSIEQERAAEILQRLGFGVKVQGEALSVSVPSWRSDMTIADDLIEEVVRIYGYDQVPTILPTVPAKPVAQAENELKLCRVKALLADRGFNEAITYSFIDPKLHKRLFPDILAYMLGNPIASDMSVMRTSLLPGLIQALCYNAQRQQARIRFFEVGRCFHPTESSVTEIEKLAILAYGPLTAEHWSGQRKVDFYDIKGDVLALWGLAQRSGELNFAPATEEVYLHPGQSAYIQYQGRNVGVVGALHPSLRQALDIRDDVYVAELDLSMLQTAELPNFSAISKFPSIRRDLALVVDEDVAAANICAAITQAAGNLLHSVNLFDIYQGDKIAAGKKSLALGLVLQDASRTLTDNEAVLVVNQVLSALQQQFNVQLRE